MCGYFNYLFIFYFRNIKQEIFEESQDNTSQRIVNPTRAVNHRKCKNYTAKDKVQVKIEPDSTDNHPPKRNRVRVSTS